MMLMLELVCRLGGHYGHFAKVNFAWNYPCEAAPSLIVLHEGKVVHCSKMNQKSGAGTICVTETFGRAQFDDEDDLVYELDLVSNKLKKGFIPLTQSKGKRNATKYRQS